MITEKQSAYIEHIENWQRHMESDLRAPDSWLALVGLEPLKAGDNTIGSAADCDAHLPDSVPDHIGVITVQDNVVPAGQDRRQRNSRRANLYRKQKPA